jgi:hypothetical protein
MEEIEVTLKLETDSRAGKSGFSLTLLEQLFRPGFRTAMLIGIALAILTQLTGINAIIYYGPRIFTLAGLNVADSLDSQRASSAWSKCCSPVGVLENRHSRPPRPVADGISGMFFFLLVIGIFFLVGLTAASAANPMLSTSPVCFFYRSGDMDPFIEIILQRARNQCRSPVALWTGLSLSVRVFVVDGKSGRYSDLWCSP